jgi:hypothetical protein
MFGSKRKGEIAETRWSLGGVGPVSDATDGFRKKVGGGTAHKTVISITGEKHRAAKINFDIIAILRTIYTS